MTFEEICTPLNPMTFEEKVKLLRNLPQFKVVPISEVKAVAFAAKEKNGNLILS